MALNYMVKAISIIVVELSKLWSGFFKVILIYLLKFFFFFPFSLEQDQGWYVHLFFLKL